MSTVRTSPNLSTPPKLSTSAHPSPVVPLSLHPAPRTEPPFDDLDPAPEMRSAHRQTLLPLSFALASGLPGVPAVATLRVVGEDEDGPRRTPRSELPDPRQWAARLVQATLEVHSGHRPPAQLVRWLREDLALEMKRRGARAARRPEPVGATRLRSVRVCEPEDGIAEVSAVAVRRGRAVALALRLEGRGGRWLCTSLDVLEPGCSYASDAAMPSVARTGVPLAG